MNRKSWMITAGMVIIVLFAGGFTFLKSYMGNNVEISSVIPAEAAAADRTDQTAADTGETVSQEALNGEWAISDGSKVYYSVTTSQETVNFENDKVSGTWKVALNQPDSMSGSGAIDMTANSSGNSMRDEHIRGADFFDAATYPEATFTAKSFENLPAEWQDGTSVPFSMKGILNVRGIDKEVSFDAQTMYKDGQLLLSGTTVVTFSDFGMKNPHSVVLNTENDIKVQLELVLAKK